MLRRSLIGALAGAPLAQPAFAQMAYRPLFDGHSLDGWDVLGDANWTVSDGVISADKGGRQMDRLEISARGDRFSVVFNGRKTVDAAQDAAHAEGPIALQYGAGIVKFRRVEVRIR
jgi:hypothetical protein